MKQEALLFREGSSHEHGVGRNQVINVLMVELRDALLDIKNRQDSQSTNSLSSVFVIKNFCNSLIQR